MNVDDISKPLNWSSDTAEPHMPMVGGLEPAFTRSNPQAPASHDSGALARTEAQAGILISIELLRAAARDLLFCGADCIADDLERGRRCVALARSLDRLASEVHS